MQDIRKLKNFCPLPWTHLYKDTDNTVRLCCTDHDRTEILGNLGSENLDDIRVNEKFTRIRQQFLDDERPSRCKNCWEKEDSGFISLRQKMLDGYYRELNKPMILHADKPLPITYLDFRPSNLCNLGCKTCHPHYSTKLAQAWKDAGMKDVAGNKYEEYMSYHKNKERFIKYEEIVPNLERVYFAGGEPVLDDEHWRITEELVNTGKTDILYSVNTNFTNLKFKNKNVLDLWKQFKETNLLLSLDGYGEMYEYMRTGAKFKSIVENFKTVKHTIEQGYKNITVNISSVAGWLNLKSVLKLHRFLSENNYLDYAKGRSKENWPFKIDVIVGDGWLEGANFNNTPTFLKEELLKHLDEYYKFNSNLDAPPDTLNTINAITKSIQNSVFNTKLYKEWLLHNKRMDKQFGTKLETALDFDNIKTNERLIKDYKEILV